MAENKTQIVITAKDQATPVLNGAANSVLSLGKAAEIARVQMAAVGAGVSVAGFAALIADTVRSAGALHDLSQQTGITVETLSGLKGVAALSDTSMEQVGAGAQKLVKKMSDAAAGSKEAVGDFKALGVAFTDGAGSLRDSGAVLGDVAKQIAAIQSPTERVAAAQLMLGKSGGQLVPMLLDLANAGDLVVKVTAQQAALADNIGDNWQRLGLIYSGTAKTIALEALPAVDAFTETLLDHANGTNGIKSAISDLAKDGTLKQWAEGAAMVVAHLVDVFQAVANNVVLVGKTIAASMALLTSKSPAETKAIWESYKEDTGRLLKPELFSDKLRDKMADPLYGWAEKDRGYAERAKQIMEAYSGYSDDIRQAAMKSLADAEYNNKGSTLASRLGRDGREKDAAAAAKAAFEARLKVIKESTEAEHEAIKLAHEKGLLSEEDYWRALGDATQNGLAQRAQVLKERLAGTGDGAEREKILGEIRALGLEAQKAADQTAIAFAKMDQARKKYMEGVLANEGQRLFNLTEQNRQLDEEFETLGMTTRQLSDYNAAKLSAQAAADSLAAANLQEAAATIEGGAAAEEARAYYLKLADARREAAAALEDQAGKMRRNAAARETLEEQVSMWKSLESTAHQTWVSITDGSKDGWQRIKETAKNTFFDWLYQQTLKKWFINIVASVSGTGVASAAFGSQASAGSSGGLLNLASTGNSLYNLSTGATGGLYTSFATSSLGQALGLSTVSSSGIAASAIGTGAELGFGGLFADGALAGAASGVSSMTALGTALPWIGGALAIASLFGGKLFGKEKTPKVNFINGGIEGWSQFETPFGAISGAAKHDKNFAATFDSLKPVAELDKLLASRMSGAEIAAAAEKIKWQGTGEVKSKNAKGAIQGFLEERLDLITDSIGGWVNDLADTAEGELAKVYGETAAILAARKMEGAEALAKELMSDSGKALFKEAETAASAFARMAAALETINPVLKRINQSAFDVSGAGGNLASSMIADRFGSADAFNQLTGTYYQNYFTEKERAAAQAAQGQDFINASFRHIGMAVPQTTAEFRALVESLDLTTERGQKAFKTLMEVNGAFAQIQAYKLSSAIGAADAAYADLERAVAAQRKSAEAQRQAAQEVVSTLDELFGVLKDSVTELYRSVESTAAQSAAEAQAFLDRSLLTAKTSGYLPEAEAVAGAVAAIRAEQEKNRYATQTDADRDRLVTAGKLAQLKELAGDQIGVAERQLKAAEGQLDALDDVLASAREQLDQLKGINTGVLTVAQAMAQLTATLMAGNAIKGGGSGTYTSGAGATLAGNTITGINGWTGTVQQAQTFVHQQIKAGDPLSVYTAAKDVGISLPDLDKLMDWPSGTAAGWADDNNLPKFAVGTNYVPYDMTAQIHEGERIIPAADNRALMRMLDGGGDSKAAEELRALREEQRAQAASMAAILSRIEKLQRRWETDGLPETRVTA